MNEKRINILFSESLYYLFLGSLLCAKGIGLYDGQTVFKIVLIFAIVAWLGKLFLTSYTVREFIIVSMVLLISGICYIISGEKGIFLYAMMVTGLKNIPIKRLFIVGTGVWTLSFLGTTLLHLTHGVNDVFKVHEKLGMDMIIRWSLGYSHPNVLHISYLVLVMFIVYLMQEKVNIKAAVWFMAGNIIIYIYSVSSTGLIIVTFYLLLTLFFKYRKNVTKVENIIIQLIFPGFVLVSLIGPIVLKGRMFEIINKLLNTRLFLAKYFLTIQPPTLFGTKISEITTQLLTMDNSYVNAFVTYGIVGFGIIVVAYFLMIRKCCREKKYSEIAIIITCLLGGLTEPFLFNTSFKNISLLFMGMIIFPSLQLQKRNVLLFHNLDKRIEINLEKITIVYKGVIQLFNRFKNKILIISVIGGMLCGIGYHLKVDDPKKIIVPRNVIDIYIVEENPKLVPYCFELQEEKSDDVIIYGYVDDKTEMIRCDGDIIIMEHFRGIITTSIMASSSLFMIQILFIVYRGLRSTKAFNQLQTQ